MGIDKRRETMYLKDTMKINLKKLIEAHIRKNKINQFKLSQLAGINPAMLSKYLSGKRGLSWKTVEKLLKIVG